MKNPTQYCQQCRKVHGNPVIELFNEFIKRVCVPVGPPPHVELELYRAYMAGQHDALAVIIKATEYPEEQAENIVNSVAIAIRDATLAGLPEDMPDLKAQVRKVITKRFFIRERGCSGN